MKKRLYLLFVIGALLAGCSNNETDYEPNQLNSNDVISFKTLRDKVISKVANDSSDNYYVYAYITGYTDWYFETSVSSSTGETTYYWPHTGSVDFYSFCPVPAADNIVVGTTTAGSSIPITYTVPTTADQDFTIATPVLNQDAISTAVPLEFSHMLSKISVQLKLDAELDTLYTLEDTWTSELSVLYTSGTINAVTAKASTNATGWTLPTAPTTLTAYNKDSIYIIMPQPTINTTTPLTLQILNVTIKTSNGDTYFVGPLEKIEFNSSNISITDFEAGYQYNFILTVTDESKGGENDTPIFNGKISFTSSVSNWSSSTSLDINQP